MAAAEPPEHPEGSPVSDGGVWVRVGKCHRVKGLVEKRCPTCKEWKPTSAFYRRKDTGASDSSRGKCKVCYRAHIKAWKLAHPIVTAITSIPREA